MAERIYIRGDGGGLEPLEEEPFSTEDELQALIAEHPELLDGVAIDADSVLDFVPYGVPNWTKSRTFTLRFVLSL